MSDKSEEECEIDTLCCKILLTNQSPVENRGDTIRYLPLMIKFKLTT